MKEGRSDIYFPGRVDDDNAGQKKEMRERKEKVARRICASAPDPPPRPCPRPYPAQPSFFPPIADGQEAAAQPRERRGTLCLSENVALIGGSVAVMRYQPPANKRINVKRWRWTERGGEGSWSGERG